MLFFDRFNRSITNYIFLILWLAVFFMIAMPAHAQFAVPTSPSTMLATFATHVPNLVRMVTALAYLMGMVFVVMGLFKLKQFGEQRTMMSSEHRLSVPIAYLTVGALLLYLPTSVNVGMSTFWTNPNPYGYVGEKKPWSDFLSTIYLVIQLIGIISFIRGLVIFSRIGGHGGQQSLSKGFSHVIGGIFCLNIYQFVRVVLMTFGITPL